MDYTNLCFTLRSLLFVYVLWQLIKDGKTYDDLSEVAKLFNLYGEAVGENVTATENEKEEITEKAVWVLTSSLLGTLFLVVFLTSLISVLIYCNEVFSGQLIESKEANCYAHR